ncbi:AAA family ATPase [Vibrio sp. 1F263]|uniref:AAA family ATPase n=1 Tax=Vibrio sp. 1F263 TaxID=3230012 RepID=UPI00352C7637
MEKIVQKFSISSLFGCQNVSLTFSDKELILIGENGSGKTTVMNMFYHMLKGDFNKLEKYDFNKVILEFTNESKISFSKYDLELFNRHNNRRNSLSQMKRRLGGVFDHSKEYKQVLKEIETNQITVKDVEDGLLVERLDYASHRFVDDINKDFALLINHPASMFNEFNQILKDTLSDIEILYFPTYRRVEEDLKNLEIDIDLDEELEFEIKGNSEIPIQFGMKDVKDRFEEIKAEVARLSSKGLNTLSAEILRQLVRGDFTAKADVLNISEEDVKVVISRLGETFDEEDKARILNAVKSGVYPESDNMLVYFLSKLVEVYEEQKEIDIYTDKFTSVCNKYLEQTELVYNKSNIEIYINSKKSKKEIDLNALSSGEQQIVSLFSKIYLNSEKRFIVLFDEPELSLSIFWQMLLLPDIVDSGKCDLLMAVTHSPFIYDNDLKHKTENLSDSISIIDMECTDEE